jgi:hypothetical protein
MGLFKSSSAFTIDDEFCILTDSFVAPLFATSKPPASGNPSPFGKPPASGKPSHLGKPLAFGTLLAFGKPSAFGNAAALFSTWVMNR